MYDYERKIAAKASASQPYEKALTEIQEQFVGFTGEKVMDYINTVLRRTRKPNDWTYGSPQGRGTGMYSIVVYKQGSQMDGGPGVVNIYFKFDNAIEVYAKADTGETLFKKKVNFASTPWKVALSIGEGWERLTTGDVDYGD